MATSKQMANKAEQEVSTNAMDFSQEADQGFEEADSDSFAIPFVRILQSNSPQCKKSDGAYIDGAEEGAIFNTATNGITEGLSVIPCHFRRVFVEWVPKDDGGGFVAEHSVEDGKDLEDQLSDPDKNGKRYLPNGNQLVDTRMHYCVNAETGDPMVICMSSTQLKKSRNWMYTMQSTRVTRDDGSKFTPPMFSSIFRLETAPESNDKGSWFGWKITRTGYVEDQSVYEAAKGFRDLIVSGKAEVKHQQEDGAVPPIDEEEAF